MKNFVGFVIIILSGAAAICATVFNLALLTLPIWGGALILGAIFG